MKFKVRVERIDRAELQEENRSTQNAIQAMERSLKKHKNYIIELQEENVRQTVHYERVLGELWRDKEDWKAQCLARQL